MLSRPLVAGVVVGATSEVQLLELVAAAAGGPLPDDVLDRIDAIHSRYPNPTP